MTELRQRLELLGLSQYTDAFIAEGFDTWDTLLDIQESDLGYLNVKLGHRRKLQRAIAEARGITADRALPDNRKASLDASYRSDDSAAEFKERKGYPEATPAAGIAGNKRKYRRHPKPDENAPERPASAYVIFSNQVREELKGQELSFADIAKTVGERWQALPSEVRDIFERQAGRAKEKYYAELAEYKKTLQYSQYQQYLADFKAKHATPRTEGKRTKLEAQTSTSTRSSSQGDSYDRSEAGRSPAQRLPDGPSYSLSRSDSSPTVGGSFLNPPFQLTNPEASPATYGPTLRSPTGREQYSPKAASPISTRAYPAYDLPHHRRSGSATDPRYREPRLPTHSPQMLQSAHWPQPTETDPARHSLPPPRSQRRPELPLSSLPPLVHTDTTASSDSGLPTAPYQSSMLPALDGPKAGRMLPQPIPTGAGSGLITASPINQQSSPTISAGTPSLPQAGQWPALLRASELARDADLQESSREEKPT